MTEKSKMKLYPFKEIVRAAKDLMSQPHVNLHQQWNCEHCGIKQTMETPNVFYKSGKCEECGQITNIEKRGCNYMIHANLKAARETNPPSSH